ncbi:TetR/AcrR family transcriptional regulator [Wenyingzhuangia sp. IMCC45533]
MRPQKVEDTVLVNNLMQVLRAKGYEGASLNDLAAASGLQKASLYHRFPGGKKDIVLSVLNHIGDWTKVSIINVINDPKKTPINKLETVIDHLNQFYDGGKNACVTKTLSMDHSFHLFGDELKKGVSVWIESFTELARLFNHTEDEAKNIAQQVIVQIQGSLVLSKTLGDYNCFKVALADIKSLYTN